MSLQYRIQLNTGDWTFYTKTCFWDILQPVSVPSTEIEGMGDHTIQLLNGILSFTNVNPGILATFEEFLGTEEEAFGLIEEIRGEVEKAWRQPVEIQRMKYRQYQPLCEASVNDLLIVVKERFLAHMDRHGAIQSAGEWESIEARLRADPKKLWSLNEMERTGGEPDVADYDFMTRTYTFIDFAEECPPGRGDVVYDREAEDWLVENSPQERCRGNAVEMAAAMGIELLDEAQYTHLLQARGWFDQKSSTWLKTPADLRAEGEGLDGSRYGRNLDISGTRASCHHPSGSFRGLLVV
jgi:hypothetical protein